MEQLTFFEKLQILGNNILQHPLFIIILLVPVILIAINKKITKKISIVIYLAVLIIVLFVGNATLFELFDNMMDMLFMALYFPSFVTLFLVVVLSAAIAFMTFTRKTSKKLNKIINIIGFVIVQTLFCLILTVVKGNDINIYEENALYSNSDILTLMQLLMGAFALQLIGLFVVWAINKVTDYLDGHEDVTAPNSISEQIEKLRETKKVEELPKPDFLMQPEGFRSIVPKEKRPISKKIIIEPQKPLDKTLIEEVKLEPIDIIYEEKPKLDLLKPENIINKNLISEEISTPLTTIKKEVDSIEKVIDNITQKPPLKKGQSDDFEINDLIIFKTKKQMKSLGKMKLVKNKKLVVLKNKEQLLVSNLVIINLNKTIKSIKKLKRIYTL